MSLHGAYHHCTSRDMCRCRHPRERGRGDPPHGGPGRRRPGLCAVGAGDGADTRHRRGARGGGERRGRGRDRRRARRGRAGDGAGGACGHHVDRRTERCDARRDRACGRDGTCPGTIRTRYHAGFVRYRGWYRDNGPDGRSLSGDGGAGLADQRQRQRPDREPGRQRARHAGERRSGRHVGSDRHRCRREHGACVHDGRTEHDVRRTRLDAGISTHRRLFLDRAGRSGDVDLAMELPVEAGSLGDIAGGIYDGIPSEELDVDLELR